MLKGIYQMQVEEEGYSKEGRILDRRIQNIIREMEVEKMKEDKEYSYSLFSLASSYGEERGFALGFKYAVRLITYCFK